ncbi:AraC family transcriptional regulator [Pedobacter chinensis]|uniref:AraC family transcriptional regulator n=1 Tax=Pedobacter chinensis TaxID=2282421 RepID=A0A369PYJ5_9SPHI|nr:AraC family transcriptional regulator [Pedobacter chinensis]RDC57332.1 AraC family transcriptional regulator [Pedobacter chinensis]
MEHKIIEPRKKIKEGFIGQKRIVLPPNIRKKIINNTIVKNFYLTAIGHYPKAANHDIERKSGSREYILLYCTEGFGYINIFGEKLLLSPNSYYIIPKNASHRYQSHEISPWSIFWVHFSGDIAESIYNRFIEGNSTHVQEIPFVESRIKQFNLIYTLLEQSVDERDMEIINIKLLNFISSFIYYKEVNPDVYNTDSISKSILYMKKNLRTRFSIEDLAMQQNLSVSHYLRSFKQKTGSSPINYFNQLKIQESCQYLYFSDMSIKEICAELGFVDQYYFSRLFKLITGTSPSRYKKLHKR